MANLPIKGKNIYLKSINYRLLKQVNSEVDSRLNSSLYKQIFIVLDKTKNPGQIEKFGNMIHKVGSEFKSYLQNKDITTVFDQTDVNGRLLILGEPGSGKTTILLKLAEELVKRAQNDHNHPIPVIFSLSSWKKDKQSIKDWVVEQLKDKYGVRKDIGKKLIDNQEIIPLLDGLDEIAAERQELCVRKMNDFLQISNWNNPLVVCSRIEEYEHLATLLQLNNSLELCPFTPEQVHKYLQDTGNFRLWNSINNDEDLNQLAQIPLFLSIIVLSAEEISVKVWQQFKTSEERRFYLFEAYISKMLKRLYKSKKPQYEKTKRWLVWLSRRLAEENATEFFIEKMQPYWLKNKVQRFVYNLIVWGIISGLIIALIFWLSGLVFGLIFGLSGLIYWPIIGLIIGLIFGMIFGLIGDNIQTIESLKFNFKKSFSALIIGLIIGLILGLILGLISGLILGLISGLIIGLIIGLILGLIFGIDGVEFENKIIPNQGIFQSIINTLFLFILGWFFAGLSVFVYLKNFNDTKINELLVTSLVSELFFGLLIGIPRSGTPAIKHFVLRVILWFSGYIPWDYAKFLNYCTNRLFLQRVGGGYRFIHKMLQDHFAQMEFERRNLQRNN